MKKMETAINKEAAFVVSSCDAYQDLWKPYFELFFRYWPDCPFPVYLISNFLTYNDPRVNMLLVGSDKGWATNMRNALLKLNYPYAIITMEDFFLDKPVNSGRISRLLAYMKKQKAGYLRLYPCPGPDTACFDNAEVGEIQKGSAYRVSLQVAIWERKTMLNLLKDGETAWQMELKGSGRSDSLDSLFLSVVSSKAKQIIDPPISYICTAVEKGRYTRKAIEFCSKEGVKVDLKGRIIEGTLRDKLHVARRRIFLLLIKSIKIPKKFYQNLCGQKNQ